jgi:hypothetical protein
MLECREEFWLRLAAWAKTGAHITIQPNSGTFGCYAMFYNPPISSLEQENGQSQRNRKLRIQYLLSVSTNISWTFYSIKLFSLNDYPPPPHRPKYVTNTLLPYIHTDRMHI